MYRNVQVGKCVYNFAYTLGLSHSSFTIELVGRNYGQNFRYHKSGLFTRVPVCCWTSCSGAFPPPICVLACYWSMAVCYWGISQSQTTTQLAGNKHHYLKSKQHKRILVSHLSHLSSIFLKTEVSGHRIFIFSKCKQDERRWRGHDSLHSK